MRMSLTMAAILAATSFTPTLAAEQGLRTIEIAPSNVPLESASLMQEEGGRRWGGGRGGAGGNAGGAQAQGQGSGGGRVYQDNGQRNWQRNAVPQAPQAAPAPQAQAAPQPGFQAPAQQQADGRSSWRGNGRGQGGDGQTWRNRQGDAPSAEARQSWRGNGSNVDGQRNWNRNNGATAAPPAFAGQAQNRPNDWARGRDWDRDANRLGQAGNRANEGDRNRTDANRSNDNRNRYGGNRWNQGDNRWNGNQRYNGARNDYWRGNQNYGQNQRWNRDWRRDGRYDWQQYRTSNRNLYRAPRYYAPYGYGSSYRRFSIGLTLGGAFFAQQYWLSDPYDYRLPPADGPYRWVRYYDDVLLVDVRDGEVVDVIYDFFW